MAITDQLGQPTIDQIKEGYFALARYVRCEAAAAAPVTPVNVEGIQEIVATPISWASSNEFFQQGGGEEPLPIKRRPSYNVTIRMLAGEVGTFLSGILGKTWTTASEAAMPMRFHQYPVIHLESIFREDDNETHMFSHVYQDLILQEFNHGSPMEEETVDIPFISHHDPFKLAKGAELVYDVHTGDASTTVFTLSSTPLTLVTAADLAREDWEVDNAVFVKQKASTADTGTRQRSGFTLVGTALTFAGNAPASGTLVQTLYAKD